MLVVSDTSAITNLIQIGLLDILRQVYGGILIPIAVYEELCEIEHQKESIDENSWIEIKSPQNSQLISSLTEVLDLGESESIALAVEIKADFLIIDEAKGRLKAQELGLSVVGILGTLLKAKELGYIDDIKSKLLSLKETAGFHISPKLFYHILHLANEL
jgi:uncharacterized protein